MNTPSPWYHHFWPWFLVVLMAISVGASLTTVVIAYGLGDLELPDPPRVDRAAP